jgi:energy-coupling factor transporter ATP-binding protein EcfA2
MGRIFPGLRPFEEQDAALFFGRDEQVDSLLQRLQDTRFLAILGLSGSGKSSLVRAGLLPALRRGHVSGAGSRWRIGVMRPGADPLGTLGRTLDDALGPLEDRDVILRSGRLGLVDASRAGRGGREPPARGRPVRGDLRVSRAPCAWEAAGSCACCSPPCRSTKSSTASS